MKPSSSGSKSTQAPSVIADLCSWTDPKHGHCPYRWSRQAHFDTDRGRFTVRLCDVHWEKRTEVAPATRKAVAQAMDKISKLRSGRYRLMESCRECGCVSPGHSERCCGCNSARLEPIVEASK